MMMGVCSSTEAPGSKSSLRFMGPSRVTARGILLSPACRCEATRDTRGASNRVWEQEMANVLAFVDDLFFQAKILETARHVGVTVKAVTQPEALVAEAQQNSPRLVVVD